MCFKVIKNGYFYNVLQCTICFLFQNNITGMKWKCNVDRLNKYSLVVGICIRRKRFCGEKAVVLNTKKIEVILR